MNQTIISNLAALTPTQQVRVMNINKIMTQFEGQSVIYVTTVDKSYGDPYWKAGVVNEVELSTAARFMVDGHIRPATEDEIADYKAKKAQREKAIERHEQNRLTKSVLVKAESDDVAELKAQLAEVVKQLAASKETKDSKKKAEVI